MFLKGERALLEQTRVKSLMKTIRLEYNVPM